jgi:hypothetical protein
MRGHFMAEGAMSNPEKPASDPTRGRLSPAGVVAIVVMVGFLIASLLYAVHSWNSLSGVSMPVMGWVFMIMGVVVTLAVGAGLMALVFYSSRKGRDF